MSSSSDARKQRQAEAAKAKRAAAALVEGREPGKRSGRKRKAASEQQLLQQEPELEQPEPEPEPPQPEPQQVSASQQGGADSDSSDADLNLVQLGSKVQQEWSEEGDNLSDSWAKASAFTTGQFARMQPRVCKPQTAEDAAEEALYDVFRDRMRSHAFVPCDYVPISAQEHQQCIATGRHRAWSV